MLLSGVYAAEFHSNLGLGGTGVAVFTDNSFHGGDALCFYKGKYSRSKSDSIEAIVDVAQYANGGGSVVGLPQFRLKLTGKILENGAKVSMGLIGHVEGDSSKQITINLVKLDDLVEA